jgi:hypothetical protein
MNESHTIIYSITDATQTLYEYISYIIMRLLLEWSNLSGHIINSHIVLSMLMVDSYMHNYIVMLIDSYL